MRFTPAALIAAAALMHAVVSADAIIGSWNIKHLGWNNDKAITEVAHVAQHFDFLAIQELMDTTALAQLEKAVEATSGEPWSSMASDDLGRSTYREHYGFLWRESEIKYDSGAVVFLDSSDVFAREPYSAKFTALESGQQFAAATVHVVYGDSVSDRLPEVEALADYWQWLEEVYSDTPRLLMGDFNLRPSHEGWAGLRDMGATPAITEGATTLGTTDGVWSNLYDNIWHSDQAPITDSGILQFPNLLPGEHTAVRDSVSDHAPVWVAFGDGELELTGFDGSAYVAANNTAYCINLNDATSDQLAELPNVGPVRAKRIIEMQPWEEIGDLTRISGLGAASVQDIEDSGLVCP